MNDLIEEISLDIHKFNLLVWSIALSIRKAAENSRMFIQGFSVLVCFESESVRAYKTSVSYKNFDELPHKKHKRIKSRMVDHFSIEKCVMNFVQPICRSFEQNLRLDQSVSILAL